jgi:suppressor for copper-sensitivity B
MAKPGVPRAAGGVARRACLAGLLASLLLGIGLMASAAVAQGAADPAASPWFETEQGKVRLIAAAPQTGSQDSVRLGLEFRLAPGWDIYWRAPGDAGLPPQIDWKGSRNLAAAEIAWPAPRRFSAYGLETIGYQGDVVLPITARLERVGDALSLRAALQYLTCKDICIPYDTVLTLDLPAESTVAGGYADLIERFAREVPPAASDDLHLISSRLVAGKMPLLELSIAGREKLTAPDAFVEGPSGVAFGAPHASLAADGKSALLAIPVSGSAVSGLAGQALRVTLVDGTRSLDGSTAPLAAAPSRDPSSLIAILGIALLGGFILNVMPCVLPILSIKFLTLAAHAGRPRAAIRRGFLASAAGIIVAFLLLAGGIMALKAAGLAVGWGLQFQHPAFLILMTALLTLFAGNLAGLFEIALPRWMGGFAEISDRRGWGGDFLAGIFATLLATPCSAPFLGTAIGFALGGDNLDVVIIFLALGIGLAAPYLAVAALPALAAHLPRPGHWMITARRILAVLVGLSAAWLLSVLATQAGVVAATFAALALLAVLALLTLTRGVWLRRAGVVAALLVAFAAPFLLPVPAPSVASEDRLWRPFDRPAIDALVHDGKIVFIDVTADWCLNCKVNERLVLQSDAVLRRLSGADVVAMRADWTRPDGAIAAFLRGFGRYGIPFYAVYGPATPDGQPLSELLTPGEVLGALGRAAPPARPLAGTPPEPPPS